MMKTNMAVLLRVVAEVLDNLDEDQINDLLNGKGSLTYKRQKKLPQTVEDNFERELMNLADKLKSAKSREEAVSIMDQEVRLKAGLIKLAKLIPVYIASNDSKQKVKEKIVDAVIKEKLRDEAREDKQ